MKKNGQFFFTFLPLLLSVGLQYLVVFFSMGLSALVEQIWYGATGTVDFIAVFEDLTNLWVTSDFNTYIMICYAAMSIAVFGLWYYMKYNGAYLPKPRTVFHPLSILGIVMLVPGTQYLSTYIVSFTAALFPRSLDAYEELLETAGLDTSITLGLFLYSVILAPFSEELIFRGVTMRQARKFLPFWAANLMQAILFGIFHMNLIQGVYAFCLGIVLGYICEKSGSIYNSVLLHMLFNFWGTVLSQFFGIGDSAFSFLFWFFFGITITAGGIVVFIAGAGKCAASRDSGVKIPASAETGTYTEHMTQER